MRRTVRSYLRPYFRAFVFALALVVFISALELLKPWPLKVIIDHVLTETPVPWAFAHSWSSQNLLLLACAGLVVVYLLLGGLRILNDYTTIRIGQKMVNDLRRDLYSQIQRLSLSFSSPPSGRRPTLPVDLRYLRDPDAHNERPFPCVVLSYAFRRHVFGDDPHGSAPHSFWLLSYVRFYLSS